MRLRLSPEANEDIYLMHEFGAVAFGTRQADLYVDNLVLKFAEMEQYPEAVRERLEVSPPIRLWRYGAHHICYRVEGNTVLVVRVLHHSMDWTNEL